MLLLASSLAVGAPRNRPRRPGGDGQRRPPRPVDPHSARLHGEVLAVAASGSPLLLLPEVLLFP